MVSEVEYTGERMDPQYADCATFCEHIHRYSFAAQWVKNQRVLDIASGEGYGSYGLQRAGARSVIGVEIDPATCARARQKYGIDVRVGSAEAIPLESNSVDVVVSFETIEHVSHPEIFVNEVSRVLVRNGTFIVSTPETKLYSPDGKEPNPYHCSEMTRDQFENLLASRFDSVRLFGQRPQFARWWSAVSLLAEFSPWDRVTPIAALRPRIWANGDSRRLRQVPQFARQNPADSILSARKSWAERLLNWSSVRPVRRTNSWSPVFLVAVARKTR